jgi:glycosyltransferase involved in cell wall biosynthesis
VKVLWWLNEYPPDAGGIATIAGLLRPALVAEGVDLELLVTDGGPLDDVDGGTPVTRRPIRAALLEDDARSVGRWLPFVSAFKRERRPDLYHVHLCEPSPILHVLTRSAHEAPTILSLHNEMFQRLHASGPDSLFGRLVDMAAVVTTVSSASADDVLRHRPDIADRLVVIPNGIAIGAEPPMVPAAMRLLAVGRLVPQKGFDRLLRAMPDVLDAVPDARLVIAGDGPEGPPLRALAQELGVAGAVDFLGHVDREQVRQRIEEARVVAMPSRFEGMPLVALEAAERGRAVVATDVGGINEVVLDGRTGVLVDPAAAEAEPSVLAHALVRALTEPGLAESVGAAARARAAAAFGIDVCARTYATVYRALAPDGPRPRVSVVVPAWNAERHVVASVRSALDQDLADIEVIVVDDGSEDETADLVAAIDDPRVVLLRQPHRGGGASRNAGIALARGDLIAHLDADDLFPEGRLSTLVALLDARPDLEAVFGTAVEFRDDDAPATAMVNSAPQAVRLPTTGVLRASAQHRYGAYSQVRFGDILEWSMRAVQSGLAYEQIPDVVLRRRVHSTNNSHKYPFTREKGRVALVKAALDRNRAAAP